MQVCGTSVCADRQISKRPTQQAEKQVDGKTGRSSLKQTRKQQKRHVYRLLRPVTIFQVTLVKKYLQSNVIL